MWPMKNFKVWMHELGWTGLSDTEATAVLQFLGLSGTDCAINPEHFLKILISEWLGQLIGKVQWQYSQGGKARDRYINSVVDKTTEGYTPNAHPLMDPDRYVSKEGLLMATKESATATTKAQKLPLQGSARGRASPCHSTVAEPTSLSAAEALKLLQEKAMVAKSVQPLFHFLDRRQTGKIEPADFVASFHTMGLRLSIEEARRLIGLFERARLQKDGCVSFKEFTETINPPSFPYYHEDNLKSQLAAQSARSQEGWKTSRGIPRGAPSHEVEVPPIEGAEDLSGHEIFTHVLQRLGQKFNGIRGAFRAIDTDASGEISAEELRIVLKRTGILADDVIVQKVLDFVDDDKSGQISYGEFLAKARKAVLPSADHGHRDQSAGERRAKAKEVRQAKLKEACSGLTRRRTDETYRLMRAKLLADDSLARKVFASLDADGSGSLDANELHHAFGRLGLLCSVKDCQDVIDLFDETGSGCISVREFLAYIRGAVAGEDAASTSSRGKPGQAAANQSLLRAITGAAAQKMTHWQ